MDEFPNFEKILAERVERKEEEIMVKLRVVKNVRELQQVEQQQEEQEWKRLFEMKKKQFRKIYLEHFIKSCIDITYDIVITQLMVPLTPDDIYKRVKYYNGVDFEKFFTPDDVKNILDGLVKNGLLIYAYGQKDSYVARRLSDNE